jgi:aryl-alcohol dehydrogenase-like predicted oxidoreductase
MILFPIPGTKKRKYLEENAAAVDLELNDHEISEIKALMLKYPDVGHRYSEGSMKAGKQVR